MGVDKEYLMESEDEFYRLDIKTEVTTVQKRALWAGLKPGMRVADLGCGSGKTSSVLHELVGSAGETVGVDFADNRISFARENYKADGLSFQCRDVREDMSDLGKFDFVWMRFVLEYYLAESFDIVEKVTRLLKPGGILCLIDLDYNCLTHFGISDRMERTLQALVTALRERANFDAYVGRKIYTYMYDLGMTDIQVDVGGHHVIYGQLAESDAFNWTKKVEVAPGKIQFDFSEYPGGHEEFMEEFRTVFNDPRRFTYSPIIICRGQKA
ncbi:MAG: class I SAM-dependent methyltransferase [Desulfobulbaceae bacterium]|uniref:Class I SAM-dependent methyltransferase n=1 Tax=Candidatus Desulfatifera sulfidica TaxID=2841691 RepID=A0A8J6NA53_9BACT|nr:class I SAM-dependent methyltransferase [Candidatus Desulfatifera sulfidica]